MLGPWWWRCCSGPSAWAWWWAWNGCSSVWVWPRWVAERQGEAPPRVAVVFRDPWLLALAKPSGLLSQPGLGPELADSLISRAQRRWPEARLVHRLDRDTSGLILLARDADTHRLLSAAFADRRVHKTYLARLATRPPRYGVVPVAAGGKPA
ncbi:MAG: hypothetical protein FJ062_05270, partial [Cyanobacteria bacterium M_DeepCast_100m_m1_067]|nr:hypothetical protein [Cyanobacteria bacterium M_DeepCast_100m_m1_067]